MDSTSLNTDIFQQKYAPDNPQIVTFLISVQFLGFSFYSDKFRLFKK